MSTAKTTAERQAAYRARQACVANDGQKRVSLWLSTGCALALARLARRHGSTQREFLERLVLAEDDKVLATMALDSPEWSAYFQLQPMRARAGAAPHASATPEA
jgi:xanthine/CO dehydrogenase XdhC/CoxF family maturation factor